MNVPYFFFHAVLKQTEKELQKCQQEIDEYETRVEEMSNSLRKKNDDEKSTAAALKASQKKVEKLQKQNDEVSVIKIVCIFWPSDGRTFANGVARNVHAHDLD